MTTSGPLGGGGGASPLLCLFVCHLPWTLECWRTPNPNLKKKKTLPAIEGLTASSSPLVASLVGEAETDPFV